MAIQESRIVPLQNDDKKSMPVIIVPGIAIFYAGKNWKKILGQNGYAAEVANFYSVISTATIDEQARRLFSEIERILARLRAERCHLLAFSMGGIASLHFLKKYNPRDRVVKCICAAAPFHGIPYYLDILAPFRILVRGLPEITRGNKLLAQISRQEDAPQIRIFNVRGAADLLCNKNSCYLPFADNLPPTNGGHFSICCGLDKQAVNQVLKILAG